MTPELIESEARAAMLERLMARRAERRRLLIEEIVEAIQHEPETVYG